MDSSILYTANGQQQAINPKDTSREAMKQISGLQVTSPAPI
jgi:hypothetical protein